ncbi:SDR family NAD(P)-dependent oxidoreductase [Variovorax arabinosiphilus]|uniref:SDR family NAD(P)-dependent oxidoreductase n=1 Tax=Variovorax arabinosiphilus TaxID=3053498 RepID=UPI0025751AF0|nr:MULTISPECIES: SDR family NAD(P)-dependent oxidoreductase [unclassified Variovorax]MDM0122956.1 SDR family NAD(P)-dependent oxidoreductase [Variovorax sp. J2L1-78]MDM0132048.1 SDR family NAD(P)-dependent oxidoreductase [Variovorax sp. J2L1-63]MDM0235719.1 SDR family NAD(P)-dependent oxidoreductase [Variovorax sp. J2R1-6]
MATFVPSASEPPHVVITGAAGALGRAVVQRFMSDGARLALIGHSERQLADAFPGLDNSRHLLIAADVTSDAGMRAAAGQILQAFQHVDTVVHVAGGFEMGASVHTLDRASWDRMMNLNAWSFVAVAQAFVPSMVERKAGSVIAVTAKIAGHGLASMSAYIASKSALQRLVEAMAAELSPHGVRVNSIAPSVLDTPANRQAMPDANPAEWVSTDVAAQTVAFLASPAAQALHGQHLALDA